MKRLLLLLIILFQLNSYSQNNYWIESQTKINYEMAVDQPLHFKQFTLNTSNLLDQLKNVTKTSNNFYTNPIIELPNEKGELIQYKIYEKSNFAPELSKKYPAIKSYIGKSLKDSSTANISYSPSQGLNVAIINTTISTTLIKPTITGGNTYIVFSRSEISMENPFECEDIVASRTDNSALDTRNINDGFLRKYRVAISTTAEFSQFWLDGTETTDTERKTKVIAALNTILTRINGIFERDFSVTMELIANNDQVVYLNAATDPYSGVSNTILQNTLDNVIGDSNYDVGHLFHFEGSIHGNAGCIACVCTPGSKGSGWTGHSAPDSDNFNMIASHEFGHQFGGWHVQSSSNCRSSNEMQEVEPGSGSTIMGYAGICPANVQSGPDDYFNYVDIRDVIQWTRNDSSCAQLIASGNTVPTVNAGNDFVIPKSTPFILEGTGNDTDGDAITFCWEENDPENPNSSAAPTPTRAQGPMFRSLLPVAEPIRYMPSITDVISGNTPVWEVLPSISRTMDFVLTVRDNHLIGAQTASDEMTVTVDANAGPFVVTSQTTAETWNVGDNINITWDVANTDQSPINTTNVDVLLSIDGGLTYPYTIAANIANNGNASFYLPNVPTSTQGRFMIKATNNIFYAINSADLNIQASEFVMNFTNIHEQACKPNDIVFNFTYNTFLGFDETTTFSAVDLPTGATISFNPASATTDGTLVQATISNTSAISLGIHNFIIKGIASSVEKNVDVSLNIFDPTIASPILTNPTNGETTIDPFGILNWNNDVNADTYTIDIATDIAFTSIIETVTVSTNEYQASNLDYDTTYYWRVKSNNTCGTSAYSTTFSFTTFCIAPSNVFADSVLLDNATINWIENGNATSWEIEIVEVGQSPTGTGVSASTNPYTIFGLSSSTEYIVYVRSSCGSGNFSDWTVSSSFITASDFCAGDHFYDTGGVSGPYQNGENITTTIAPSSGNNTVIVAFNYFSIESGWDYLRVYDGSDINAPLLGTYTGTTLPGPLTSNNPNGTLTFWFTSDSIINADGWDATVTCINISCPNPSNIETLNISPTSVDLNWTAGNTETDWEIEYDLAGFTQGSGTIVQTSTNPFTLTGLTQDTNYDVYLRANCGVNPGDDDSGWVGPITFTTLISCPQPTNFSSTNITLNSVDLSWIAGNTETDWEIEYDLAGFTQGSGTLMQLTSNTQTLTGLIYNTNYDVYLRANCGISPGDDDSNWVGPITFKTLDTVAPSNLTAEIDQTNGEVTLNWSENSGFYEDFTDGVANNWIPVTGDWNVSNSTYNATRTTHDTSSSYYNQDFSSFEFEMRAKKNGGGNCNISMYFNGDPSSITTTGGWNNAYSLMYCTNGSWKLSKIINGDWTSIVEWTSSSAIITGNNWNVLKVVYVDGYINAYINDVLLGSYYDVTFPSGKVGIKMYDSANNDIDLGNFDYISLIDLSNTTTNYTFDVEEPNSSRNIYSFGDCNNEETCGNNEIIDVETTPIPKYGNSYTYRNNIIQAFQNYKIYRDGIEIGTSTPTTYLDQLPTYGTYEYHITSMYDEGESNPSNTVMVTWYTCPQPTDFSETNVTPNSVDLSWVAGNTETDWEIEYGITGFTQGSGVIEQTSMNPFTLTGLNGDTNYDVYLRANCGVIPGDDDSLWVGPISFTTLISCPIPTNFNTSNATANTVELSWILGNSETNWEIEYGLSGFTQGSGTIEQIATNPYILSGLNSSTNYDVYLRANCGVIPGDDDSLWAGPISFTTACDVFVAPFNESFANYSIPNCWTQSGSEYWNFSTSAAYAASTAGDHTPGGGTNYAWIDGSTPNGASQISTLTTPIIDISNLSVPQVSFSIFSLNSSGDYYNTLDVEFYDGASWNTLLHLQESNGGWADYTYVLTNYTIVGDIQLRFTIEENSPSEPYNNDILIDDVTIDEAPSCPKPTGLVENNITASTVDLSWIVGNTETDWEIEYGLSGFTQGNGTTIAVATNPYTLTGLIAETSYDVYLKAICGVNPGDDDSLWTEPITFTTLELEKPYNLTADLNDATGEVTLNWNLESNIIGDWSFVFDWGCDGNSGNTTLTFYVDNTFTTGTGNSGTYSYNSNIVVLTYESGTEYTGTVDGNSISGTMVSGGSSGCWTATKITTTTTFSTYTGLYNVLGNEVTNPTSSTATVVVHNEIEAFQNYKIYRNGTEIETSTLETYLDQLPAYGNYDYYVTSMYDEGESLPSNTVTANWHGTPNIIVSPLALNQTLYTDQTAMQTITVSNNGDDDLNYSIDILDVTALNNISNISFDNLSNTSSLDESSSVVNSVKMLKTNLTESPNVLIFRDNLAWGYNVNITVLEGLGAIVSTANSSDMSTLDLSSYDFILFESQQPNNFYTSYVSNMSRFENYLNAGGIIQFNCASYSTDRITNLPFPGGMQTLTSQDADDNNYIVDFTHPIVAGLSNPLIGNSASHEGLENLPIGANIITENETAIPTTVEYNYGSGHLIVTGMTFEFGYANGMNYQNILPNTFMYIFNDVNPFWLSTNIISGTVTAGSSVDIDVQFDSTGLAVGTYNGIVRISSNDPDEPIVNVTAELIIIDDTDSIDELSQFNFSYYPNPFDDSINLSANQNFNSIKVYSMLGQELMEINPDNQSQLTIDVSKLSVGTYFIKVEIDGRSSSMKIIKK